MLEYDCLHNIHMCITLVFIFLQWFSEGTSIQSKYLSFHTPSFNSLGATQLLHIWDFGPLRDSPLVKISLTIPKKLNFLHFSHVNSTPFRSTPAARWSIASPPFGTSSFQLVDGVSMSTGLAAYYARRRRHGLELKFPSWDSDSQGASMFNFLNNVILYDLCY
jgi:hypothetical protein